MLPTAIVLGCGPAGLLAAHACRISRMFGTVRIISRYAKSPLYGAQYLHASIPMLPVADPTVVKQILWGTPEGYAKKVYAELYDETLPNSTKQYHGDRSAWDIRAMYDWLWAEYNQYIEDVNFTSRNQMLSIVDELRKPLNTRMFCTIPKNLMCIQPEVHEFKSKQIWAIGDTPDRKVDVPTEEDQIICNGQSGPSWYRLARVFGYTTVEWPDSKTKPPIRGVAHVTKPLSTTCDCWQSFQFLGRHGQWKKGVLAHTAFFEAADKIQEWYRQGLLV